MSLEPKWCSENQNQGWFWNSGKQNLCRLPPCRNKTCHFREVVNSDGSSSPALRLCNSFWSRQVRSRSCLCTFLQVQTLFPSRPPPQSRNMKTSLDLDELIFGMASQIAEREDNIVVEDLRGDSFRNSERFSRV